PRCRECSGRRLAFASARAAVEYDGSVRRFVSAWKERGLRRLAVEAAGLVISAVPPPRVAMLTVFPPGPERVLLPGHPPPPRPHPGGAARCRVRGRWGLAAPAAPRVDALGPPPARALPCRPPA